MLRRMPSFDITTGADLQEVDNALNQARKELANRYDFKGAKWDVELDRKAGTLKIAAEDGTRLESIWEILREKMVKRGISSKNLQAGKIEDASVGTVRQVVTIAQGIPVEKGREIVKHLKESGLKKVQASIQGEEVRVSGPKRDDLQAAMQLLKKHDFGLDLKFGNFRE
jgi:uncharacterized protein YajQ (UPF0234 family)